MSFKSKLSVCVTIALVVVFVGVTANAGTISIVDITGDTDCGISSANTYTHKIDMGKDDSTVATVNGVAFDLLYQGADNPTVIDRISDLKLKMQTFAIAPNTTGFNDLKYGPVCVTAGSGMADLLEDMLYTVNHHTNAKLTLTGLTDRAEYDLRLYYRPITVNATRNVTLGYDVGDDGSVEDTTQMINQDAGEAAHYISYAYTATASGTVSVDITFDVTSYGWCWYGMTNQVVPEPSTLALLLSGLVGLLAYAWRKRK